MEHLVAFKNEIDTNTLSVKVWNVRIKEDISGFKKAKHEMFGYICEKGTVIQAEWLHRQLNIDMQCNKYEYLLTAINHEQFDIAEFIIRILKEKDQFYLKNFDVIDYLRAGKRNIIKWIVKTKLIDFSEDTMARIISFSVTSEDIDLYDYLVGLFGVTQFTKEYDTEMDFTAFKRGNWNFIERLESVGLINYITRGRTYLVKACLGGKLDLVKWLIEEKKIIPMIGCHVSGCQVCSPFVNAVVSGNIDLVAYLYDNKWTDLGYSEGDDKAITVMDLYRIACQNSNVELLKLLWIYYSLTIEQKLIVIEYCISFNFPQGLEYLKKFNVATDKEIINIMSSYCQRKKGKSVHFFHDIYYCPTKDTQIFQWFKSNYGCQFEIGEDLFVTLTDFNIKV